MSTTTHPCFVPAITFSHSSALHRSSHVSAFITPTTTITCRKLKPHNQYHNRNNLVLVASATHRSIHQQMIMAQDKEDLATTTTCTFLDSDEDLENSDVVDNFKQLLSVSGNTTSISANNSTSVSSNINQAPSVLSNEEKVAAQKAGYDAAQLQSTSQSQPTQQQQKLLLQQQQQSKFKYVREDLRPGMRVSGFVRKIVNFGVYVVLPGIKPDALIHVKDISREFVHSPEQYFQKGDPVAAYIKHIDYEDKKKCIALSLLDRYAVDQTHIDKDKNDSEDINNGFDSDSTSSSSSSASASFVHPYLVGRKSIRDLKVGKLVTARVVRISNYGAYFDIGAVHDAFMHVSDFPGSNPKEAFHTVRFGKTWTLKIVEIDTKASKIRLSAQNVPVNQHKQKAILDPRKRKPTTLYKVSNGWTLYGSTMPSPRPSNSPRDYNRDNDNDTAFAQTNPRKTTFISTDEAEQDHDLDEMRKTLRHLIDPKSKNKSP